MRAVGARRARICAMFALQSLITGLLGVAFALSCGTTLAAIWARFAMHAVLGWTLEVEVPHTALLGTVVLALVACLAAAIVPARLATRMSPAAALRYE